MRLTTAAIALATCLAPLSAHADLELPRKSPHARVEQTVGVSTFAVDYSSPGKRGRVLFGGLLPYGEAWRTGANGPTTLIASHPFTVGEVQVPAGSYRVVTIPRERSAWTVILNSKLAGGGSAYDPKANVAEVEIEPELNQPARERLTFLFENTTNDATELVMHWGLHRISVPLKVDTGALVEESIAAAVEGAWRPHFESARYYLDVGNSERALELLDASIAIRPTWWNLWYKADTLAAMGEKAKAVDFAKKAKELAKGDRIYEDFYKARIEKALREWTKSG